MDTSPSRKCLRAFVLFSIVFALYIRAINGQCSSHHFACDSKKCIPLSWQCDEDDDCGDGSDERSCEARTCSDTEFKCANGKCVPSRWQCDNENDCGDNSDENPSVCLKKTCESSQFACQTPPGVCIPVTWHCDGQEDCADGSDERQDCEQITCSAEEFTCKNNKCITQRWVCDQDDDCGDKSDELNCPNVNCTTSEFTCANGKCIAEKWRCDDTTDCSDGSDEEGCAATNNLTASLCNPREFACANRKDCVHITWRCDGDPDCPDKSDEENCTNTCRQDQFQCKNLQCIPIQLHCDNKTECPDGSDEEGCDGLHPGTCDPLTQFDCGRNHCIPLDLVCDLKNDCGDWEDEPPGKCHKNECSENNGGCTQECHDLPIGYECRCLPGFVLTDNQTCDDVNECDIPGSCSQLCHNTKGNYKCDCLPNYMLEPNNTRRCKAKEGHPSILFANRQDIRKIDLETSEYVSIVSNLRSTVAIDYDFRSGTIVWSDVVEEAIKSAPIESGTPVSTLVSSNITTVDGIAVDWVYGHVYWTDTGKNKIEMVDKTGKLRKVVVSSELDEPRAIVLNPLDGWMYWTDWGEPAKIERAGMDGSHRSTVITTDIKWPNGLAIDFVSKKIFWADAKLHILSSADYNGANQRVVLSSPLVLRHPFSIDVFEDWVYWTDWESEGIHRVNKFTGEDKRDVAVGIFSPMDIHIYHPYKQPPGTNQCGPLNGHCSHLCLPSPDIATGLARPVCACPDGMTLTSDGTTCVDNQNLSRTTEASFPTSESTTLQPTTTESLSPSFNDTSPESAQPSEGFAIGNLSTAIGNTSNVLFGDNFLPNTGRLTGIIIGALSGILLILAAVIFLIYKHYLRKNVTSMNFDNPVYRKTTEDQFSLEKNQYQPARSYPPSLEPLTSPGTNEFV